MNFRLVASTWPNIEERVAKGAFLPDLYYRLKFLTIDIPPLRERVEDIEPLIHHLLKKNFEETGVNRHFLMRAIRCLEKYHWPGNVGELDGYISSLLAENTKTTLDETMLDQRFLFNEGAAPDTTFAQLETRQGREKRQLIQNTIRTSKSILHAAQKLGMRPSSLHTMISRLGLQEEVGVKE